MRTCMLAYAFYDTDNRIIRYAETMVMRGDQVDVVCLGREGQANEEVVHGVRVLRIQKRVRNEKRAVTYLWRLLSFFFVSSWWITKLHLRKKYDLVHVHSVPDFEVFAAWLPKLSGTAIILDIHDIVPEFYSSKFGVSTKKSLVFHLLLLVERASAAYADKVIVSNDIWKERLTGRSVRREKCHVIINSVDHSVFHRRTRTRQDERFIVLYPGGLQRHQGVDLAVCAFQWVRQAVPGAELHIYGEGSERENIVNLIGKLNLFDTVFLHPVVPLFEIPQLMANADLGLVPKRADSFGDEAYSTKILEFMSQGIPVLVSRTTVDSYYFREPAVKFFNSGDERDLAEKIILLARDPSLRMLMVRTAEGVVAANNWSVKKKEYLHLLDTLRRGVVQSFASWI